MIAFFARHPTAGNLLMLFLAVIGLLALPGLQRETFPSFASDELEIRVVYPGASPEDVEEAVCQRLEDAIESVSDVAELRCEAREGLALTVVEMMEGGDLSRFIEDIKSEVEAIDNFPEQVEMPRIRERGRTDNVIAIAVTGPMAEQDLKAYAEQTKRKLQQLSQIAQVDISGFSTHQLRIDVPTQALRQYGLSVSDVANAVSRQGIDLPSGSLETRDRDMLIRFTDQRRTPRSSLT